MRHVRRGVTGVAAVVVTMPYRCAFIVVSTMNVRSDDGSQVAAATVVTR
jgi:hypothetical protein